MILDNDISVSETVDKHCQILTDLEKAVRHALKERAFLSDVSADLVARPETTIETVWLSFNIIKRSGWRVTPIIHIGKIKFTPGLAQIAIKDIKLDMNDIYKQASDRLERERLSWDDVKIDIEKEYLNLVKLEPRSWS